MWVKLGGEHCEQTHWQLVQNPKEQQDSFIEKEQKAPVAEERHRGEKGRRWVLRGGKGHMVKRAGMVFWLPLGSLWRAFGRKAAWPQGWRSRPYGSSMQHSSQGFPSIILPGSECVPPCSPEHLCLCLDFFLFPFVSLLLLLRTPGHSLKQSTTWYLFFLVIFKIFM